MLTPLKCDGKASCSRCAVRQLDCIYAVNVDHRGSAPRSLVSSLQARIKLLENIISLHSIDIDGTISKLEATKPESKQSGDGADESVPKSTTDSNERHFNPEGTLCAEDVSSRPRNTVDGVRFFGPTSGRLDLQLLDSRLFAVQVDSTLAVGHEHQSSEQPHRLYGPFSPLDGLPKLPCELIDELIELYFEWEQPWFQVVNEAIFRESRKQGGRYFTPLLLCCIIALASRYSDRPELRSNPQDPNTAGLAFLEHAEKLLQSELKYPSVTTIQALALMAIVYVVRFLSNLSRNCYI